MPPPGSIFISYRRSDSIGDAGRIYDYLEPHFGRARVFKDVDSIPLGVNFREYLDQEVGRCQVLIAVIGPNWLTVIGEDGKRRLDSPNDFCHSPHQTAELVDNLVLLLQLNPVERLWVLNNRIQLRKYLLVKVGVVDARSSTRRDRCSSISANSRSNHCSVISKLCCEYFCWKTPPCSRLPARMACRLMTNDQ